MAELNLCFASLFGPPCKWFSIIEPESISILVMGVLTRVGEHRKIFFRSTCDGGGDDYYDCYDYHDYVFFMIILIMIIMIIMFMIIIIVVVITIFITLLMVVMNHANNNAVDNVFWWCCCWWWCNMLGAPYHKPRASLGNSFQLQESHSSGVAAPSSSKSIKPGFTAGNGGSRCAKSGPNMDLNNLIDITNRSILWWQHIDISGT